MTNVFIKIFGKSNNMKILDYLLDLDTDVSVMDICDGTELTRKTVEKTLFIFVEEEIIISTRLVGKTKMYKLNTNNKITKKLLEINYIMIQKKKDWSNGPTLPPLSPKPRENT